MSAPQQQALGSDEQVLFFTLPPKAKVMMKRITVCVSPMKCDTGDAKMVKKFVDSPLSAQCPSTTSKLSNNGIEWALKSTRLLVGIYYQ